MEPRPSFRCVIHGSFRKHFSEIKRVRDLFVSVGIDVLAPQDSEIIGWDNGFALLSDDNETDRRFIELRYLHHLRKLSVNGFSYFVNPEGYIGVSASYELGIAQTTNVRCFFSDTPSDHPVYIPKNSIWKPEYLTEYISRYGALPEPKMRPSEAHIHKLWEELMVPGSVVAVGSIIEHKDTRGQREILLVRTHKWGGRFSIVGGKVRRNERLQDALLREVKEETGLDGALGRHVCTFDQLKNSGYYTPGVQHIFVDNVIHVERTQVQLNEEAQEYVWMPAGLALRDLDIEPNARHTIELYYQQQNGLGR